MQVKTQESYYGKDLWKRWVLSMQWKRDGESADEGNDVCEIRWQETRTNDQEVHKVQLEVDSRDRVMHKEQLFAFKDEEGGARVTISEKWVLCLGWTEIDVMVG